MKKNLNIEYREKSAAGQFYCIFNYCYKEVSIFCKKRSHRWKVKINLLLFHMDLKIHSSYHLFRMQLICPSKKIKSTKKPNNTLLGFQLRCIHSSGVKLQEERRKQMQIEANAVFIKYTSRSAREH